MSGDRSSAVWPIVGVLLGLFVLSVISPRAWQRAMTGQDQPAPCGIVPYSQQSASPRESGWEGSSALVPQLSAIPPLVQSPDQDWLTSDLPAQLDEVTEPTVKMAHPPILANQEQPALAGMNDLVAVEGEASMEEAPPEEQLLEEEADGMNASVSSDAESPTPPCSPELTAEELAAAVWCEPTGLIEYLKAISSEPKAHEWVAEVESQLQQLRTAMGLHGDEAVAIVGRLAELCREAGRLAVEMDGQPLGADFRRAQHALDRRIRIWKRVLVLGGMDAVAGRRSEPDPAQLATCLAEVETLIRSLPGPELWRSYLELDGLRGMQTGGGQMQPSLLAAEVLRRMTRVSMTPEQQRILASEPIVRLAGQLQLWASEPVEMRHLVESVERYEQKRLASDARTIAEDCIRLMSSPVAEERKLGEMLDSYYRNANVRLTLTAELLNRLVPKREPLVQQVNDRVLGRPVYGRAVTTTDATFRLLPDPHRLLAALEIHGQVASETSTPTGAATFFNSSWADFAARKQVELGTGGLTFWPTEVEVQNDTRLRSVRTDFDIIPLVGALVQEIARSKAEEKQPEALREMDWKLSNRVKEEIDGMADVRLANASSQLKGRVFGPLAAMGLGPTVIASETTESRMTSRLCVATPSQLGAHTPRPRALNNSLASVQIHESAMGNVVEQLELNGQTLTVAELRHRIATRLNQPEMLQTKNEHDDVSIRFAPENAVQVRFQNGQLAIMVFVAHLCEPGTGEEWENFQVQAYYRPHINGRRAEFAREGAIRLIGEGLSMRSQIALRGIFSKAFSKQRPLVLTPENMLADQRLSGLGVSQIVMEDGWVSIALGPQSTSADPMVARLPKTDEE